MTTPLIDQITIYPDVHKSTLRTHQTKVSCEVSRVASVSSTPQDRQRYWTLLNWRCRKIKQTKWSYKNNSGSKTNRFTNKKNIRGKTDAILLLVNCTVSCLGCPLVTQVAPGDKHWQILFLTPIPALLVCSAVLHTFILQFACINLNKCRDECSWMFRGSCECCLHDLPPPVTPSPRPHFKNPPELVRNIIMFPLFRWKEDADSYHFNECMKLVSKSEGAINATSQLIDFEHLGKFVLPIQPEKSIQLTNELCIKLLFRT